MRKIASWLFVIAFSYILSNTAFAAAPENPGPYTLPYTYNGTTYTKALQRITLSNDPCGAYSAGTILYNGIATFNGPYSVFKFFDSPTILIINSVDDAYGNEDDCISEWFQDPNDPAWIGLGNPVCFDDPYMKSSEIVYQETDFEFQREDYHCNFHFVDKNTVILPRSSFFENKWNYPVTPYDPGSYQGRSFFYDTDHLGEDEALVEGAPVRAIGTGKIVWYKKASGYGELVAVVEHDLGRSYTFKNAYGTDVKTKKILSIYGHIRPCDKREPPMVCTNLSVGEFVDSNTVIGYINDKDNNGDGREHLHLGIRLSSAAVAKQRDPAAWFRGYERDTTFGTDFTAASTAIQLLRGE
jgi:hypothetical protein